MATILMSPQPAERLVRFVGDTIRFSISHSPSTGAAPGWHARLRTTLGRGRVARREIVQAHAAKIPAFGARWHDVPMEWDGRQWTREILLTEAGYFAGKAYMVDPQGYQHWPEGPDVGVSVHPDWTRTANTLYCAFTRLFGETRESQRLLPEPHEAVLKDLEGRKFATLPPSGTFRDLARQVPHIVDRLGCRILHLLPIHPTPTSFARFGRMGSPYAALDLTSVDPALVELDRRTTGIEQFEELTRTAHQHGARVFLDIVINHTGWGSRLFEKHPEFFRREADGRFASPGAWGTVWEDLVELEQRDVALWDILADALLAWCRRGVDGFRCDAGYKIPTHVWQYINARVHAEFPETVFLLEGLGGSWESTEALLTEGGMQWAYSELFQNDSGEKVQWYLDYALRQSQRVGTYIHYSETHDNNRLAACGRSWSLLRNRLCALTSVQGGFGFTCGVEWLATEKILVHQRTGLAWNAQDSIVQELATLNRLLADHPAFFDRAELTRISPPGSPVFALHRRSAEGQWQALVLANLSTDQPQKLILPKPAVGTPPAIVVDLLGQSLPSIEVYGDSIAFALPPAAVYCLSDQSCPPASFGENYRHGHALLAWAVRMAAHLFPAETIAATGLKAVPDAVSHNPVSWLALLSEYHRNAQTSVTQDKGPGAPPALPATYRIDLVQALESMHAKPPFPCVVVWRTEHIHRVTPIPPGWWLLVLLDHPFQAHLRTGSSTEELHEASIPTQAGHLAAFPPQHPQRNLPASVRIQPYTPDLAAILGQLLYLPDPGRQDSNPTPVSAESVVLLTNKRGGMARLRIHFGTIRSKYDAALAANLHPAVPVDRHVLVKRVRAWLNADGFLSPLDGNNLVRFEAGPPAVWSFKANAGDGRCVHVQIEASMPEHQNRVIFRIARSPQDSPLAASLTIRVDLEDRSYHAETFRNADSDRHFHTHTHTVSDAIGFDFTPAEDRQLRVRTTTGLYHPQPEWSEHILHPVEAQRGQVASGDAYSPGWFEIPLAPDDQTHLILDAEPVSKSQTPPPLVLPTPSSRADHTSCATASFHDSYCRQLRQAIDAFVVRRGSGQTIIAGYPWFLDWGRDTLIAARGLLAAGRHQEVDSILHVFASFADRGTLPNAIHGENASNRDTSDAPLWFIRLVEESAQGRSSDYLRQPIPRTQLTLLDVAHRLARGYVDGTPNGIRVDPRTGLVWSPAHFTWMDTNHPACTPREGYPIEIQALWIAALRFLGRHDTSHVEFWNTLEQRATHSFRSLFWHDELGWFADVLHAPPGTSAEDATRDSALRCNALLAVTLGLATPTQSRRCVDAAFRHLLIPGAIRSLAPLPVFPPLSIRSHDGRLLNDPQRPYWGRYEGDEDTRRKPAYHNGTAWTWFLPTFCEAFAIAWDRCPEALLAARAMLATAADLLPRGCHGHLPEILDGDAPHAQRGCDAQAWSVTETLRVWLALTP